MTDVRIVHRFDCSEKTYWDRIFFDDDFNRSMYLQHLQFQQWQVVESHETDTTLTRVIAVAPKVGDLPGAIKSLVGDNLVYKEEGTFDKRTRRYRINVVPSVMTDKIAVKGETWVEELSPTQCNRIFVAQVAVKMFGIGSIVEKRIIADLQLSYNAGAVFTADYLKQHGLCGT
jgi:hypothetical protein